MNVKRDDPPKWTNRSARSAKKPTTSSDRAQPRLPGRATRSLRLALAHAGLCPGCRQEGLAVLADARQLLEEDCLDTHRRKPATTAVCVTKSMLGTTFTPTSIDGIYVDEAPVDCLHTQTANYRANIAPNWADYCHYIRTYTRRGSATPASVYLLTRAWAWVGLSGHPIRIGGVGCGLVGFCHLWC